VFHSLNMNKPSLELLKKQNFMRK